MSKVFHVSEPGNLVQLVPVLLGFHPVDSAVLVGVRDGRVELAARVDLKHAQSVEDTKELLSRMKASAHIDAVAAVAYGDRDQCRRALEGVEAAQECPVEDLVWVGGDRWESLRWDVAGRYEVNGPLTCEAIFEGFPVAPSRDAIANLVQPGPGAADVAAAIPDAADSIVGLSTDERRAALAEYLRTGMDEPLNPSQVASVCLLLRDPSVRDLIIETVTEDIAREQLPMWLNLVSRVDGWASTELLGVVALVAWLAGQGALMASILERAEEGEQTCVLLTCMTLANVGFLPPSWWADVRQEFAVA